MEDLVDVLDLTDHMVEVCRRPVPKVPALRGRTVLSLFLEDSTRTRLSFETAAKRLSADTMTFSASSSSVNKGESLRDTVETLDAMGIDAVVVRHRSSGVPWQVARWTSAAVDQRRRRVARAPDPGAPRRVHHPDRAPCGALRCWPRGAGPLEGLHVGILGDVKHSRVARSERAGLHRPRAPGSRWWRPPRCCRRAWPGGGRGGRGRDEPISTTCCPSSTWPTCCACSSSARSRPSCPRCGSTRPGSG